MAKLYDITAIRVEAASPFPMDWENRVTEDQITDLVAEMLATEYTGESLVGDYTDVLPDYVTVKPAKKKSKKKKTRPKLK